MYKSTRKQNVREKESSDDDSSNSSEESCEQKTYLELSGSYSAGKKGNFCKYFANANEYAKSFIYKDHVKDEDEEFVGLPVAAKKKPDSTPFLYQGRCPSPEYKPFAASNYEKPVTAKFVCEVCNKFFDHHYALERHRPVHQDVRKFSCEECGKSFRQSSTLRQHRVIHSLERPFKCEMCNKSFNRISTLISHRKTHSMDKPYACHMCSKSFHQKGNLRNHIFIHTNERPYICPFCNKGFNQMSNLTCHKQKAHASEMSSVWKCERCPMTFEKRSALRLHEMQVHQITSTQRTNKRTARTPRAPKQEKKAKEEVVKEKAAKSEEIAPPATAFAEGRPTGSMIIPPIQTAALQVASDKNQMPFAVLHLLKGPPMLMRILKNDQSQTLIRPASNEDFQVISSQQPVQTDNVNIAIVAAIFQCLDARGEYQYMVEPPNDIYRFYGAQTMETADPHNGRRKFITVQRLVDTTLNSPYIQSIRDNYALNQLNTHLPQNMVSLVLNGNNAQVLHEPVIAMSEPAKTVTLMDGNTWNQFLSSSSPISKQIVYSDCLQSYDSLAPGYRPATPDIVEQDIGVLTQYVSHNDVSLQSFGGYQANYMNPTIVTSTVTSSG